MATYPAQYRWAPSDMLKPSAQNANLNSAGWGGLASYGQGLPSMPSTSGDSWNDLLRANSRAARTSQTVPLPSTLPTLPTVAAPSVSPMEGFYKATNTQMPAYSPTAPSVYGTGMQSLANVGSVNTNTQFGGGEFIAGMSPYMANPLTNVPVDGVAAPTGFMGQLMQGYNENVKPLFGTKNDPGPLSLAFGLGQGVLNAGLGLKSYNLVKDTLAFQKDAFNKNYANQKENLIEDRSWQAARQAAREGKDYNAAKADSMAQWGKRLA